MSNTATPEELVMKKLAGVASEVTINVPWKAYQRFTEGVHRYLRDHDVDMNMEEIQLNPKVFACFMDNVDQHLEARLNWEIHSGYSDVHSMFGDEIAKAERENSERMHANMRLYQELGSLIPVAPKNFANALEILRLAGLVEPMPGAFIYADRGEENDENQLKVMAGSAMKKA